MSNSLLNFVLENPGIADYMDLRTGTIIHTGVNNNVEVSPVSTRFTNKRYSKADLEWAIESFYSEQNESNFRFNECEEICEGYVIGTFRYKDKLYCFTSGEIDELSALVNDKSPEQLSKCMDTCRVTNERGLEPNIKAKLLLYICRGF